MRDKKIHKALRGMKDIMPPEVRAWQRIEESAREIMRLFRYREIRTPYLEETALFVSTIGRDTDIVKKEMFSFRDRGQRNISLRPEGTAPVIRAYLESGLHKKSVFQKLYYIGPMFRAERPQAGRSRQFYQIGVEAIGSQDPGLDAEVIVLLARIIDSVGIVRYEIALNNLGCAEDKRRLSKAMKKLLSGNKALLCQDCKERLKQNPLRILDCKKDGCRALTRKSLRSIKYLCQDCIRHFDGVRRYLDVLGISYRPDPYIVRGLDYYTRTVFEVTHSSLGSQNAIGAGGRYDNLIEDQGGPSLGACGFALGIERMLMALGDKPAGEAQIPTLDIYFAALGEEASLKAFQLLNALRGDGISCDMDYEGKSLKAKMRSADKVGARLVAIIGEDEIRRNAVTVRDMTAKEQTNVRFDSLVQEVKKRLGKRPC